MLTWLSSVASVLETPLVTLSSTVSSKKSGSWSFSSANLSMASKPNHKLLCVFLAGSSLWMTLGVLFGVVAGVCVFLSRGLLFCGFSLLFAARSFLRLCTGVSTSISSSSPKQAMSVLLVMLGEALSTAVFFLWTRWFGCFSFGLCRSRLLPRCSTVEQLPCCSVIESPPRCTVVEQLPRCSGVEWHPLCSIVKQLPLFSLGWHSCCSLGRHFFPRLDAAVAPHSVMSSVLTPKAPVSTRFPINSVLESVIHVCKNSARE